ncbi:Glycerol-3-phosphate responsive antiterminator [Planococcus massiliensis]|uniref:Glycerol-3-phosphate responsive antiterminator n=1 Tax=Planococcus massiliensis TaxID=1499687 RepID=A0A098EGL4_9BACL|nr:glycerol-3-phosphate responsive antiterminator [Planococcus massiliensis]CEG21428.1 Glycerol-3-phosphate responsive antiterminator [Planococcus massiliensis]
MCSQGVPAIRNLKDVVKVLKTDHERIIFLETRLSQVESTVTFAKKHGKETLMHVDFITRS